MTHSRAFYMSKVAKELGVEAGVTKYGEIADILETTMRAKEHFPKC
jgi:hypothetical protein